VSDERRLNEKKREILERGTHPSLAIESCSTRDVRLSEVEVEVEVIIGAPKRTAHGAETTFHFFLFIFNFIFSASFSITMYIASASASPAAAEVVVVVVVTGSPALWMSSPKEAFISSGSWSRERKEERDLLLMISQGLAYRKRNSMIYIVHLQILQVLLSRDGQWSDRVREVSIIL
tara:strand:- start:263 stop:793 length:531 start_codon:yes stop_codon:yes gene_type:complete